MRDLGKESCVEDAGQAKPQRRRQRVHDDMTLPRKQHSPSAGGLFKFSASCHVANTPQDAAKAVKFCDLRANDVYPNRSWTALLSDYTGNSNWSKTQHSRTKKIMINVITNIPKHTTD